MSLSNRDSRSFTRERSRLTLPCHTTFDIKRRLR